MLGHLDSPGNWKEESGDAPKTTVAAAVAAAAAAAIAAEETDAQRVAGRKRPAPDAAAGHAGACRCSSKNSSNSSTLDRSKQCSVCGTRNHGDKEDPVDSESESETAQKSLLCSDCLNNHQLQQQKEQQRGVVNKEHRSQLRKINLALSHLLGALLPMCDACKGHLRRHLQRFFIPSSATRENIEISDNTGRERPASSPGKQREFAEEEEEEKEKEIVEREPLPPLEEETSFAALPHCHRRPLPLPLPLPASLSLPLPLPSSSSSQPDAWQRPSSSSSSPPRRGRPCLRHKFRNQISASTQTFQLQLEKHLSSLQPSTQESPHAFRFAAAGSPPLKSRSRIRLPMPEIIRNELLGSQGSNPAAASSAQGESVQDECTHSHTIDLDVLQDPRLRLLNNTETLRISTPKLPRITSPPYSSSSELKDDQLERENYHGKNFTEPLILESSPSPPPQQKQQQQQQHSCDAHSNFSHEYVYDNDCAKKLQGDYESNLKTKSSFSKEYTCDRDHTIERIYERKPDYGNSTPHALSPGSQRKRPIDPHAIFNQEYTLTEGEECRKEPRLNNEQENMEYSSVKPSQLIRKSGSGRSVLQPPQLLLDRVSQSKAPQFNPLSHASAPGTSVSFLETTQSALSAPSSLTSVFTQGKSAKLYPNKYFGPINEYASNLVATVEPEVQPLWKNFMDTVVHGTPKSLRASLIPLARVKKVIKSDPSVDQLISNHAPLVLARACELFVSELTSRAWSSADQSKRRTLQVSDISTATSQSMQYDFLMDIIPRKVRDQKLPQEPAVPSTARSPTTALTGVTSSAYYTGSSVTPGFSANNAFPSSMITSANSASSSSTNYLSKQDALSGGPAPGWHGQTYYPSGYAGAEINYDPRYHKQGYNIPEGQVPRIQQPPQGFQHPSQQGGLRISEYNPHAPGFHPHDHERNTQSYAHVQGRYHRSPTAQQHPIQYIEQQRPTLITNPSVIASRPEYPQQQELKQGGGRRNSYGRREYHGAQVAPVQYFPANIAQNAYYASHQNAKHNNFGNAPQRSESFAFSGHIEPYSSARPLSPQLQPYELAQPRSATRSRERPTASQNPRMPKPQPNLPK